MPARVEVHFGPPVDLTDFYGREREAGVAQAAMERIIAALAALAGQPDFQTQIAGRVWKPTDAELAAAMDAADEREAGAGSQGAGVKGQGSESRVDGGESAA